MLDSISLDLCPNCFKELHGNSNECPFCKYNLRTKSNNPNAFKPMTVVTGRYVIGRLLGAGGFGITYKAKDLLNDEICAIKEYFPISWVCREKDGFDLSPKSDKEKENFKDGKKNFLKEARTLNMFDKDSNVVHVTNFFESNNTAYIVMEFLDGVNLRGLINQSGGKLPLNIGIQVLVEIVCALKRIHEKDILHRDISPENIYITKEAKIKLIDFGSARQVVNEKSDGLSVFVKHGLAPIEQYYSNGKQGPWTDIYAIASTFYQAVSGVPVPSAPDRLNEDKLVPLIKIAPSVPSEWSRIIDKCLKIKAEDRYQNVEELLKDIYMLIDTVSPPPPQETDKKSPYLEIVFCKYKDEWKGTKKHLVKDKEYSVGRSVQKSDFIVDMSEYVSRMHCVIRYNSKDSMLYVKDVSANGTFLENGKKLNYGVFEKIGTNTIIYLGSKSSAIRVVME